MGTDTRTLEPSPQESPGGDRVREHTDDAVLARLDAAARRRVRALADAGPDRLTARIEEVERESDMERVLATNASVLSLAGLAAGLLVDRRFLALPVTVSAFLLLHARQGWCPPVPVFRRFGVRTRQEIDAEKHALKFLRGDFEELASGSERAGHTDPPDGAAR